MNKNIVGLLIPALKANQNSYHIEAILKYCDNEGNYTSDDHIRWSTIKLKDIVFYSPEHKELSKKLYKQLDEDYRLISGEDRDRLKELDLIIGDTVSAHINNHIAFEKAIDYDK